MVTRVLLAALAVAGFCAGSIDAFSFTSTPTAAVPADKRVSADQQFAKTWEIRSRSPYPISTIKLEIPGRVFISHVDNTSSDSSAVDGDVFGRIKASGSSAQLLDLVGVVDGNEDIVSVKDAVVVKVDPSVRLPTGALLVEIELLRKNALVYLVQYSNCDVVMLENVLYSKDQDPFVNTTTKTIFDRGFRFLPGSIASIFVSDKSGALELDSLRVVSDVAANIQFELGGLKVNGSALLDSRGMGNVTMFVDDLNVGEMKLGGDFKLDEVDLRFRKGKICISTPAQTKLDVTVNPGAEEQVSYPGKQTGAFACTKLALPERVPVQVSKQGDENTSTPAPSSAAASWRSLNALAFVLTAAAFLQDSL